MFTIRPPTWFRRLYLGSFVGCVAAGLLCLLAWHTGFGTAFGLMLWVCALMFGPIALVSSIRRLECSGDTIVLVQLTGRLHCAAQEIGSIRLVRWGNGMSRCFFVKRDGSFALGKAKGAWPTQELHELATRLKLPIVEAR